MMIDKVILIAIVSYFVLEGYMTYNELLYINRFNSATFESICNASNISYIRAKIPCIYMEWNIACYGVSYNLEHGPYKTRIHDVMFANNTIEIAQWCWINKLSGVVSNQPIEMQLGYSTRLFILFSLTMLIILVVIFLAKAT